LQSSAIELMRQRQFAKARAALEQAYDRTPPEKRTRPLILNRAILDVTLKDNAMRAVRELGEYLKANRDIDVPATDILGSALNLGARTPRIKQGPLWQAMFREWDRRNFELEYARPGYHRFGGRWIDEQEYLDLQAKREDLKQAIADKYDRVMRAWWNLGAAQMRLDQAMSDQSYYQNAIMDDNNLSTRDRLRGRERAGQAGVQLDDPILRGQSLGAASTGITQQAAVAAQRSVLRRATQEHGQAKGEYMAEFADYQRLKGKVLIPEWPMRFDPVEMTELTAPPLPPPDPKAAAEAKAKEGRGGWQAAFGNPGAPLQPATAVTFGADADANADANAPATQSMRGVPPPPPDPRTGAVPPETQATGATPATQPIVAPAAR
jgi:hypothetical protein